MCCHGCQAVAELIAGVGLSDYYRYRTQPALKPEQQQTHSWQSFERAEIAAEYVHEEDGLQSVNLLIEGLRCSACAWLIERRLKRVTGISRVSVNLATLRAQVVWHETQVRLVEILRTLNELGYQALPVNADTAQQHKQNEQRSALRRIGVAGIGMMQVMMYVLPLYSSAQSHMDLTIEHYLQLVSLLLTTPVLFYAGWPFLSSAARALRNRNINMDVPVALALLMAYAASTYNTFRGIGETYFDSVTMFVFLLSIGRYVEMMLRHRSASRGDALAKLQPVSALLYVRDPAAGNQLQETLVRQLKIGDEILVRAGACVPADGEVIVGTSSVDESLLTGEALLQVRAVGSRVLAGSINAEAPLRIRITALGTNTLLSGVIRLLERAQTDKPRMARVADRVARHFLHGLLALSLIVALLWWHIDPSRAFEAVLAVLVVSCPCALSLATPTVIAAASSALAKHGLLIVHADAIEQLAQIERMVFDKTGTLSTGKINISHTQMLAILDTERCLDIAAAMETGAEHPIARAFQASGTTCLPVSDVHVVVGEGVQAEVDGNTYRLGKASFVAALSGKHYNEEDVAIVLGNKTQLLARFALTDPLRGDAASSIKQLQALGINTCILSGDANSAVKNVANLCGITQYQSRCQPEDKLNVMQQYQLSERVAMVGDGINDAPVLSAATVSIVMGAGSGLAHSSADAVLLSNTLSTLPPAIILARRARIVMRQNLWWAALYNFTAIPLAALGLIPPWLAAVGMSLSSLLVVLNATRLLLGSPSHSSVTTTPSLLHPVVNAQ